MRRTAFALFLIALFALVCAPDIARRFVAIDAPWLGWVQAILLTAGVTFAARARLRDAGKPEAWLWQALLVVTPIYALFASPLAGLLPVPSQLSTLALIGANGAVFGGLIFLTLTPSEAEHVIEEPERREESKPDSDSGVTPVPVTADPTPASPPAKPAQADDTPSGDTTPDNPPADTASSDASSDSGSGGDGGGGAD